ncbi:MAG TPA: ABC transporter permease [Chloroflexota bacterium]|nr:ABC transporter permease [Chloroflexota bacterium]
MGERRGGLAAFPILGGLLVFFLLAPLVYLGLSLDPSQVQQVAGDVETRSALAVSLLTATLATAILAVLAVPLGYLLARRDFPGKSLLNVLVFLPLICPPAASGILLLLFFGPHQGLGELFNSLGVQFVDNPSGIVLAQMFVSAPFVIVTSRAAFEAVPLVHENISLTLGEGPWMTFWRVALPLARDGVVAGLVFAWMRSMGEFGATLVLAFHPYTLPVLMWVQLTGTGLSSALPVVTIAIIVTLVVLGTLFRFDRRVRLA